MTTRTRNKRWQGVNVDLDPDADELYALWSGGKPVRCQAPTVPGGRRRCSKHAQSRVGRTVVSSIYLCNAHLEFEMWIDSMRREPTPVEKKADVLRRLAG